MFPSGIGRMLRRGRRLALTFCLQIMCRSGNTTFSLQSGTTTMAQVEEAMRAGDHSKKVTIDHYLNRMFFLKLNKETVHFKLSVLCPELLEKPGESARRVNEYCCLFFSIR